MVQTARYAFRNLDDIHNDILFHLKPTYVTNDSKIKNRFALAAPTNCTDDLFHLYENQLVALNEVFEAKRKQDVEEGKVSFIFFRHVFDSLTRYRIMSGKNGSPLAK